MPTSAAKQGETRPSKQADEPQVAQLTREELKKKLTHIVVHQSGILQCAACGESDNDHGRWLPDRSNIMPTEFVTELINFAFEHERCNMIAGGPAAAFDLLFDEQILRVMRAFEIGED